MVQYLALVLAFVQHFSVLKYKMLLFHGTVTKFVLIRTWVLQQQNCFDCRYYIGALTLKQFFDNNLLSIS